MSRLVLSCTCVKLHVCVCSPSGPLTYLVSCTGQLLSFGANQSGQLGLPAGEFGLQSLVVPFPTRVRQLPAAVKMVSAGHAHAAALTVDGQLFCFGPIDRQCESALRQLRFEQVACGMDYTAIVTRCGRFCCTVGHSGGRWGAELVWTSFI